MRSCMETVCESVRLGKILWRSLSKDDQLVSKKVLEGILTIKRLLELSAGMPLRWHDEEEIKNVCYTIVGAMFEMEGERQSCWSLKVDLDWSDQLISSILEENIDEVIKKMVSENINNRDVGVLGRVKEVMLLPSRPQRVVVCILGESPDRLTALARELYEDNGFKGRMDNADFGWVSMRQVRMLWALMLMQQHGNNHTMYELDDPNVNPWVEMSRIQDLFKELEYMLVVDGVNNEAEWEWVDTTARSSWPLLITTCSKQVARIIASAQRCRYPIVYNMLPDDDYHLAPNRDSKKDVGSGPSTHFLLKKMFSIKGKGGKRRLNAITKRFIKSFITHIALRGYYLIEHQV